MKEEVADVDSLKALPPASFKDLPRNRIRAYKVFRNATFKLVSPSESFLNKISSTQYNRGSNCSSVFINNINKSIMMQKISEVATPYFDKSYNALPKQFQRIIPHPIIDDSKFKYLLDEAIEKESYVANTSNDIAEENTEIMFHEVNEEEVKKCDNNIPKEDIDEYEQMLINRLQEIRLMKEKAKVATISIIDKKLKNVDPIFVYHSNHSFDNIRNDKINAKKSEICDIYNIPQTIEDIEIYEKTNFYHKSKEKSPNHLIKEKEIEDISKNNEALTNYYYCGTSENDEHDRNINVDNEFEVDIEDHKGGKENATEDNVHIALFFKCSNGKKIRFKIRYFGKMGQAFKAFSSRMNVTFISDIQYKTVDGRIVNFSDTPKSLNLKPYDIIMVSNS